MTSYYSHNDVINAPIDSETAFIIANERRKKDGVTGFYYTIFPSFNHFLRVRDRYPHCHEKLMDHRNVEPNNAGRLVFDFDIPGEYKVPKDFKEQVEATIELVATEFMKDVDTDRFEYVWSTSPNTKKTSKHLTVKNCYFVDWRPMTALFYKHFIRVWDETYSWVPGDILVDSAITRVNGSLRMVGSRKLDGTVLSLDDEDYGLQDSLIRIYVPAAKKYEQHIQVNQLLPLPSKIKLSNTDCETEYLSFSITKERKYTKNDKLQEEIPEKVYDLALTIFQGLKPMIGVFKKRSISGPVIYLDRKKKAKCLMSKAVHEKEHACLIISVDEETKEYHVLFKCFRECNKTRKAVKIATIDNITFCYEVDLIFD